MFRIEHKKILNEFKKTVLNGMPFHIGLGGRFQTTTTFPADFQNHRHKFPI